MKKYLYLTEHSWADAWVNGGIVPLSTASTYKSTRREGVYTPDENLIDTSSHPEDIFAGFLKFGDNCSVVVSGNIFNGVPQTELVKIKRKTEDGLILCLANTKNDYIAERLGKIACVEIQDIKALKLALDKQIGVRGKMKVCEYTQGHKRNHFLKSEEDSWQDEYRIFWPNVGARTVEIPRGAGIKVMIRGAV